MKRAWPILCLVVVGFYILWAKTREIDEVLVELEARSDAIAGLDLLRRGTVHLTTLPVDQPPGGSTTRVTYSLVSPRDRAEDTEIRGLLDGSVKHAHNQGTAFHIRLGRRYTGMFSGQFELKRGLFKWVPPELPPGGTVVDARARFWVEGFFTNSPLTDGHGTPLHVYAYALDDDWGPGLGGVNRDTLSPPAPGEANWLTPREGQRLWEAPGALAPILGEDGDGEWPLPVATGVVEEGESELVLEGPALARHIQECFREGRSIDLLLKLDDADEDCFGTQFALITSDFGDDHDRPSRRPRLEYDVEIPGEAERVETDFVLEAGQELILPPVSRDGRTLLDVVVEAGPGSDAVLVPPEIWIRGGDAGEAGEWELWTRPVIRAWAWSQVKISAAPQRTTWGDPFRLTILEPWVKPGPRETQVPRLLVVAPSGARRILDGRPGEGLTYVMELTPDEPGLWRYGWSFRCESISAPFSHQGQGVFYVDARPLAEDETALEARATELVASLSGRTYQSPSDQVRINAFIRQASRHALLSPEARARSEAWIQRLKDALPPEFHEDP